MQGADTQTAPSNPPSQPPVRPPAAYRHAEALYAWAQNNLMDPFYGELVGMRCGVALTTYLAASPA